MSSLNILILGSSEREEFSGSEHQKFENVDSSTEEKYNFYSNTNGKTSEVLLNPLPPSNFVVAEPTEDWDEEIEQEEIYQDTLNVCSARKGLNSLLIDPFLNNINRYPPSCHAFSRTACYTSLVYNKSALIENGKSPLISEEEGQFSDADS